MSTEAPTPCEKLLRSLLGEWEGAGKGEFPTMKDFEYGARAVYRRVPEKTKAYFIHTSVESWRPDKRGDVGMHYENGFMRCTAAREVAWGLAHNFAGTEAARGIVNEAGTAARFESTGVGNVGKLKATARELKVDPEKGTLLDTFAMATAAVPLTHHLATSYTQTTCFL